MFPVAAIAPRRSTASLLPTISSIFDGRYFSTQGIVLLEALLMATIGDRSDLARGAEKSGHTRGHTFFKRV